MDLIVICGAVEVQQQLGWVTRANARIYTAMLNCMQEPATSIVAGSAM